MKDLSIYILAIYVLASAAAFIKWYEYSQERKLRDLISWSALGDYCPSLGSYSYTGELLVAVLNAQYNNGIDEPYRISGETEERYVIKIIEEYQKDTMRSYFKGRMKLIKSKYTVSGKEYFLIALCSFLESHQCDDKFLDYDMCKEMLEYKRYGDWGGPCYDATYSLTDFAVVFYKVYYATYLHCKNSKIANPSGDEFCNDKCIKEILDTRNIHIARY